jgi:hypothetical protein
MKAVSPYNLEKKKTFICFMEFNRDLKGNNNNWGKTGKRKKKNRK